MDQKVNQRQNTVVLEQQIYASPENFTPTLLVLLETFRRSGQILPVITFAWKMVAETAESWDFGKGPPNITRSGSLETVQAF